jgi:3'-phosphoadenosine 5'-phosphosulfate sulfotransferase (PAPS reductase)/FAD synthetase
MTWSSEIFARLLENKKVFVLFSGGKDSLVALAYTLEVVKSYNIECELRAIHINTGISVPEVEDYVRNICRQLGVELILLRPEKF